MGASAVLRQVTRVVGEEGLLGLYVRLRNPRPLSQQPGTTPTIPRAVMVTGPDGAIRRGLERALAKAGIAVVVAPDEGAGLAFRVDPDVSNGAPFGARDVLILCDRRPEAGRRLLDAAKACRAVLDVSAKRIGRMARAGVPVSRLFQVGEDEEGALSGAYRFLAAAGAIPAERIDWREFLGLRDLPKSPRLCLSLPETTERRAAYEALGLPGFRTFDGVRLTPGWRGAAHSYRVMAQACIDQGIASATVCEDDLKPRAGFAERYARATRYLDGCEWDVFSGLVTTIDDRYRVTHVVRRDGEVFVHLDRCVGMVFGIFNHRALAWLASWREEGEGPTIDRHLEAMPGLRVVTTLPFLVDHRDDLTSAVWGFRNGRYRSLIRASERRLARMVAEHEAAHPAEAPPVTAPKAPLPGTAAS